MIVFIANSLENDGSIVYFSFLLRIIYIIEGHNYAQYLYVRET